MADLKGKLQQSGDTVILIQANQYLVSLNTKMTEAGIPKLEVLASYLSKYEVIDHLRKRLNNDYRTKKFSKSSISQADFDIITPLLDTGKEMTTIATDEEGFNKLEAYLNELAENYPEAFDPPLVAPYTTANGTTVYPIPQSSNLDPRRFGRVIEFAKFTTQQQKWLSNNSLLYGFTLYEDYGLYFLGSLDKVKTQVQSEGINKLLNKFQPRDQQLKTTLTSSAVASAKDPIAGDLDLVTGGDPAIANNGKTYGPGTLAMVSGQVLPVELAKAAFVVINAAKLEGINLLPLNSGFRPATTTNANGRANYISASGKTSSPSSQYLLRTQNKTAAGVAKWGNKSADGKFGPKSGIEGYYYYAAAGDFKALTAVPGGSPHGSGISIDFGTGSLGGANLSKVPYRPNVLKANGANYIWLAKNSWKYGFVRTVASEEWHYDYLPALAAQGPYARLKDHQNGANRWYVELGLDKLTM